MVNQISQALSAYQTAATRAVLPSADEAKAVSPAGTFSEMVRSAAEQVEKDNQ